MLPDVLKILILDDTDSDVELVKLYSNTLESRCVFARADSRSSFEKLIVDFRPDVIISDYKLVSYDGIQALDYVTEHFPEIPLIMVTGTLGEELAVQIIKRGAYDFILKENLNKLPKSIVRTMREAEEKRKKTEAERQLIDHHKQTLELQSQLLSVQMNPHFMFNALSSVQYYLLKQRSEDALQYLYTFTKLIRTTLDNSRRPTITLSQEIEYLDLFLASEKKRLNNIFEFDFTVGNGIDPQRALVPPMILQPHVENAVIHGVAALENGGRINISFDQIDDSTLQCRVSDNGIGRTRSQIEKQRNLQGKEHTSLGVGITDMRLNVLNELHGGSYSQEFSDILSEDGTVAGTCIKVMLPMS